MILHLVLISFCFNFRSAELGNGKQKRLLLTDPDVIHAQLASLERKLQEMESKFESEKSNMQAEILKLQNTMNQKLHDLSTNKGVVFTRWGRADCPAINGTTMVYSGLAGGGSHNQKGGGTDYICLPHDPDQGPLSATLTPTGPNDFAHIYGAEYEFTYKSMKLDDDVPCAVCIDNSAITSFMVPGKSSCPKDWRKQYDGLLCSNYYGHDGASEYSCLDSDPHYIDGRRNNANGKLFYPTISKCGSLQCPPYVEGAYVRCAICTR